MNLIHPTSFLLQAAAPQAAPSPIMAMAPFVLMFVVFYFLLIRPQKKQQDAHKKMLTELKKGDKVVTNGGIMGVIVGVKEKSVVLKVGDADTKIEFIKDAVSTKVTN